MFSHLQSRVRARPDPAGVGPGPAALLFRPSRCTSVHFSSFLRRDVRCAIRGRHDGPHRYRTMDEIVSWV